MRGKDANGGRASVAWLSALLVIVVLLLVAGCGGDADGDTATVSKPRTTTPESTLEQLWSWLQAKNVPAAATLYDQAIGEEIGPGALAGALRQQVSLLSQQTPQILGAQRTRAGTLVTVRRLSGDTEVFGSYLLRKTLTGSHWVIRYDSFLGEGLLAYGRDRAQARIDPKAENPSPAAVAAGNRLLNRYDALFAPGSKLAPDEEPAPAEEQAPPTGEDGAVTTGGTTTEGATAQGE